MRVSVTAQSKPKLSVAPFLTPEERCILAVVLKFIKQHPVCFPQYSFYFSFPG